MQRESEGEGSHGFGELASGKWAPTSLEKGQWREGEQEREREEAWDTCLPAGTLASGPLPVRLPCPVIDWW